MRARFLLLVLAILLVAGFAALNWPEVTRMSTLNFGLFTMEASLGAILLGLLALGLLLFMASSAMLRSRMMITENRYTRDLQAQRDLADRAEASRFTELRQHLDTHFRESRQRDAVVNTEFEKAMLQSQRDLRAQLDQLNHSLVSRLGDLEGRLDTRSERLAADLARREAVPELDPREVPPRDRERV